MADELRPEREAPKEPVDACVVFKRRNSLYRKILSRYRDLIEAQESKSISEMLSLADPSQPAVIMVKTRLVNAFNLYVFERDFEAAANAAFEFVRDHIENDAMPLDFWLSAQDVVELGCGDEVDKALLLCAVLQALGCSNARIVVETEPFKHAFVAFEHKNSFYLFDASHDIRMVGEEKEVLARYFAERGTRGKVVYEFNHKGYKEWSE